MSQKYIGGFIGSAINSGYSALFNGASSYLSLAGASQYAIATSTTPFTIEFWIRPTSSGGVVFTEQFTGSGNTVAITCSLATAAAVETTSGLFPAFGWFNGLNWVTAAASTTALVSNIWSHVAFVFTGSTSKIYINGIDVTKASTPTPATTWGVTGVSGDSWYISKQWQTAANYINGNISNFRFVNGTAVYTSNFTPPTAGLSAIPNTVLLICQSPTFVDNSIYNATITNNGSVLISNNGPFPLSRVYSPQLGAATPGVWTLNQAATAAAQRSWPMFDPEFNITTGVVHGTGTNGGTNNTFLDSSSNGFPVTRNGNTTQGTFTPFSKPAGYWSNYFDGVGDYLSVADNAALQFGTNDFTVEFFANIQAAPGTYRFCVSKGGASTGWSVFVENTLGYWGFTETNTNYLSPIRCLFNQWTHVALVRSGTAMQLYVDGVFAASTISTTNFNQTDALLIGVSRSITSPILGNISNLRILKGQALYTSNFTPPTKPLEKIPNTSLLTCLNNRFVDISDNGFTITQNGGVGVVETSPFFSSAYSATVNGGDMFFDGTGDYLSVADNASLEPAGSEFCIEALIYPLTVAAGTAVIVAKRATSAGFGPILITRSTATITVSLSSNNSSYDIASAVSLGTIITNQWYHVAVYRVGNAWYGSLNGTITTLNASNSSSLTDTADSWLVGSDTNANGFNGHISNVRFVIGSPVYSGSSAPIPTAPFTPTSEANTQLLLSGTNAAIFDNASNITIETVNTSISTAQSKYGSGSIAFNGTNAYAKLISPLNTSINLLPTLGNFTIEAWINPTNLAQRDIFYIGGNTGSYASVRVAHSPTGALQLLVSTTGAAWAINVTSTRVLTAGVWSHIAVVRAGVNIALYLNGVLAASGGGVPVTTALLAQSNNFLGAFYSTTIQGFFNGYMSDFRMTNYARYMGNFTPPTSTIQNQ